MDDRERIARLERAVRRWTVAAAGAGVALAVAAVAALWLPAALWQPAAPAAATFRDVRTRRLVLVDPDGHERAALARRPGATMLVFFDGPGTPRLSLMLLDDGSARLSAYDEKGRPIPTSPGR